LAIPIKNFKLGRERDMRKVIEKGNIVRTAWPGKESLEDRKYVNLYLGSGRFGGCFDAWGLMNRKYTNWCQDGKMANTVFMHADHYSRGSYGLDYYLPVARLAWLTNCPEDVDTYRQELNIYDGRLETSYLLPGVYVKMVSYFNPYNRDIFAMELKYEAYQNRTMPGIILLPQTEVWTQYGNRFTGEFGCVKLDRQTNYFTGRLRIGTADSYICLKILSAQGTACIDRHEDGVSISFEGERGYHLLLIGVAGWQRKHELLDAVESITDIEAYSRHSAEAWHKRWGDSWIEIPADEYQALWCRSLYYMLCSCSSDATSPSPPNGWTGNMWNFHFPQDFSYIVPALLRLGHLDIVKAKVEFYRSMLDDAIRNTRRIYGVQGAMWPWEFPIGPNFELFRESFKDGNEEEICEYGSDGSIRYAAPNWYQFEIHNSAYPARMAYETSLYLNDDKWTREVAWPIIRESTRFYVSIMNKEADGTWGIHVKPSMGQDEMGGHNEKNYLCALFSAKYCLKKALEMANRLGYGAEESGTWKRILEEGLAFKRLFSKKYGMYYTCESLLKFEPEMNQKHPVQLNPLTFLPLEELEPQTLKAYQERYELCPSVKKGIVMGWTLGAYWLAASHMRDAEAMLYELSQMLPKNYTDDDMIQIYESSGLYWSHYYTTTHGLYLQALNDALVSDYWGEVEIGAACPDRWKEVRFNNLYTKDGKVWSGEKVSQGWKVTVLCAGESSEADGSRSWLVKKFMGR